MRELRILVVTYDSAGRLVTETREANLGDVLELIEQLSTEDNLKLIEEWAHPAAKASIRSEIQNDEAKRAEAIRSVLAGKVTNLSGRGDGGNLRFIDIEVEVPAELGT